MNKSSQQGLTLLELMVALVLGLLIVAAGLAVFLNAQRAMGFQTSMGDIQQNANFGLSMLTQDLRHANLNTPSAQRVNNKFVGSGIVFVGARAQSAHTVVIPCIIHIHNLVRQLESLHIEQIVLPARQCCVELQSMLLQESVPVQFAPRHSNGRDESFGLCI